MNTSVGKLFNDSKQDLTFNPIAVINTKDFQSYQLATSQSTMLRKKKLTARLNLLLLLAAMKMLMKIRNLMINSILI